MLPVCEVVIALKEIGVEVCCLPLVKSRHMVSPLTILLLNSTRSLMENIKR